MSKPLGKLCISCTAKCDLKHMKCSNTPKCTLQSLWFMKWRNNTGNLDRFQAFSNKKAHLRSLGTTNVDLKVIGLTPRPVK